MDEQLFDRNTIPADVVSVKSIVNAMYECVSFLPGSQPNYSRLQTLFHPQASIIPPKVEHDAEIIVHGVDTFISQSRGYVISTGLEREGFYEREIARKTESFGSIVHVFSTYESRHRQSDPTPFQRGINSIQLGKDGKRWWILSIVWDIEREGNQILPEHLE
jgi:hypothetical protein